MDDWMLCNEQQIPSFPSLIMFPKKQQFTEDKVLENLFKFALSFTKGRVNNINDFNAFLTQQAKPHKLPWLITYCFKSSSDDGDDGEELNYELNCMDDSVQQKLSIMLYNLVRVGSLTCNNKNDNNKLCSILKPKKSSPIVFYYELPTKQDFETKNDNELKTFSSKSEIISSSDYKQIAKSVLSYLPDIEQLDEVKFNKILENLRDINNKNENPWLIQFVNQAPGAEDLELRKLPSLLRRGQF